MTAYRAAPGDPCNQPLVILACKCIAHAWPVFASLGGRRPEVFCELHGYSRIRKQADGSHWMKLLGIKVKKIPVEPKF